jgi:protein SCO1/2
MIRSPRLGRRPAAARGLPALRLLAIAWWLAIVIEPAHAHLTSAQLRDDVGFEPRLGVRVPLDTRFVDEAGRATTLGDPGRGAPILVAPVYFDCQDLCPVTLEALREALDRIDLAPGRDFSVAAVSIDPHETTRDASRAKVALTEREPRRGALAGWRFLTGDAEAVAHLTEALGVRARRDDEATALAHPSLVAMIAADGTVTRYFFGPTFAPRDLRHGIVDASRGTVGTLPDRVWLLCHRFDPQTGRYESLVVDIARGVGIASALALATAIAWLSRARPRPPFGRAAPSVTADAARSGTTSR